ncbi:MAG: sulfotransferase [Planctomycetota bacterium]
MHLNHIIIAGAQKSGTTTLYRWLAAHPQVGTAIREKSPGSGKELRYFCGPNWGLGFDWYASRFPEPELIGMDATPEYLCSLGAAPRIARVFPDAKLIVTLREPVQRAISQFHHYQQVMPLSNEWDWRCPGRSLTANVRAELNEPLRPWRGLLGRGLYSKQLTHLMEHVPPEQILVLVLEEWMLRPAETYAELLRFLELEPFTPAGFEVHHHRGSAETIADPKTVAAMKAYFLEPNQSLFSLLGRDIPTWTRA